MVTVGLIFFSVRWPLLLSSRATVLAYEGHFSRNPQGPSFWVHGPRFAHHAIIRYNCKNPDLRQFSISGYGGGEQTTPSRIDDSHHSTPTHRPSNKTKLSRASSESQLKSMTLSTPPASQKNNSSTRTGRMRSVKQKNKSGTVAQRREPRSASARRLFLSLRKNRARSASRERTKDDARNAGDVSGGPAEGEDSTSSVKSTELSSDANLPGILKIFGGAVSPGANYKSVLATRQSDSCELVKMALQRYGIARQQAKQYVLCEVVGRVKKPAADKSPNALKIKSGKKKRKSG